MPRKTGCTRCGYIWEYTGSKRDGEAISCPRCLKIMSFDLARKFARGKSLSPKRRRGRPPKKTKRGD